MLLDNCVFKFLLSFINNLESKASANSCMTIRWFCIYIMLNVGVDVENTEVCKYVKYCKS